MKLKDRIKTYNFWVSLSSAIFLMIKLLGEQIGFRVDESIFNDLITSLCGILVILGIIVPPSGKVQVSSFSEVIKNSEVNESSTNNIIVENDNFIKEDQTEIIENNIYFDEIQNKANESEIEINNTNCSVESENNSDTEENTKYFENNFDTKNELTLNIDNQNSQSNLETIKSDVAHNLILHESLFKEDINVYIELLQNEINLIRNR